MRNSLTTRIPVTRREYIPIGSTAASMPPTVTSMLVLNSIYL
ncbi:hypothetical protein [Shewanella sp.]|nr:hypothetical protein [Shewanella sp.]